MSKSFTPRALAVAVLIAACGSDPDETPVVVLPVVTLANLPTTEGSAQITVSGNDVYAYSFRLDDAPFSDPVLATSPLVLADLTAGPHVLEVVGINGGGGRQAVPTRHEWSVALAWRDASVRFGATSLDIEVLLNGAGQVRYTIATADQMDVPAAAFAQSVVADGLIDVTAPDTAAIGTVESLASNTTHYVYLNAIGGALPVQEIKSFEVQLEERHATRSFVPTSAPSYEIGYYVYAPEAYYKSDEDFPLLVFFHGAGERGPGDTSELFRVLVHGPPSLIDAGQEFPFIVVSPQTAFGLEWDLRVMDEVVNLIQETHRVDRKRIYITGISMGGNATWNYVTSFPDKVAAAIPIAGWGTTSRACLARDVPIWAFHGDADPTVDVSGTRRMVSALERCDPPARVAPRYTEYRGVGHNSWTRTYDNSATGGDIYEWLLTHENTAPLGP